MFSTILSFELKYRFKRPATWGYWAVMFLFSLVLALFGSVSISGGSSEKVFINGPAIAGVFIAVMSVFGIMLATAVMGVPVYRDIEHKTQNYYFSYPISEKGYLMGRFVGSFLTLLFIGSGMIVGHLFGCFIGKTFDVGDNVERIGPYNLLNYLWPYLVVGVPNLFFAGSLFFSLVALTKRVFVTYAGGVVLLVTYLVASSLMTDLDNKSLAAILDPFALGALDDLTRYWTVTEQNTRFFPLEGNFLWNRLLWIGVGLAPLLFLLFRFDFQRFIAPKSQKISKKKTEKAAAPRSLADLPVAEKAYTTGRYLRQMLSMAKVEFRNIVRDPFFIAILLAAALFLFLDNQYAGMMYGTDSLPTTYLMLESKDSTFYFVVIILIIFITGEVVHRDRTVNFHLIGDALPLPNWLVYGSKFLAMIGVMLFIPVVGILCGVIWQTIKGYFDYNFALYLQGYVVPILQWTFLTMITFLIHTLVNNKMTGHVVNIAFWAVLYGTRAFSEYKYMLLYFNAVPTSTYSDMNGFGFTENTMWYLLCWGGLAAVFLVIGNLFWSRGTETNFKNRWRLAMQRFTPATGALLSVFTLVWLGSAGFIYYNQSVLNKYRTAEEGRKRSAEYEEKYRKYYLKAQPKVTSVKVEVDLFPKKRMIDARGRFVIKNKHNRPLDSLILNVGGGFPHYRMSLKIDGVEPKKLLNDTIQRFYIYQLPKKLMPNDSAVLEIASHGEFRGFRNGGEEQFTITDNGTFVNQGDLFPSIGYSQQAELSSERYRKKYKLPIREFDMPKRTDSTGLQNFLFTQEGDWITFEGTVSTEPDQIAIMPGYLQKEWTQNGRKYFHYQQNEFMDLFFNVASARYAVHRETVKNSDGQDIKVEIFHHPTHNQNITHFMNGLKDALRYCSSNFRPYQFRQMRILEFPRYQTFAQSFPNTIMYSENFGFLADFSDPNKTDYAYYVTAHEVAHQWWGHQVMPSFTRGANNIAEALAEYSSHMVLHHTYGRDVMQERLKYALDQYLRGRGTENKGEQPLMDNENGAYIWYGKGTLTFYALQDMVGEQRLNTWLKDYAERTAFRQKAPFTTTDEWYNSIYTQTPDSLKYFVEDCIKKITLYENKVTGVEATPLKGDQYKIKLTVETKKLYFDKTGKEIAQGKTPNYIDIGVFTEESKNKLGMKQKVPLYLQKHKLSPGKHTIELVVKGKPLKGGIDPYNKLIDRISDDNVMKVEML
ncbi:ABC-type transport system involved in multi-copper enzyme maturation permease subunit [Runella defluvii]|uniref:ABC-type transport system involved in multi-copper enzyme maturation permease subunit n=1 Tax=Runella defluvii TaxID=370973 RepID=A0A7W5ZFY1_9BACT|nr:M1 family aminopeptidase [Runella defluvii]MBB3836632.1 ABC-type transport system involved in multi-copper enzyme maturation permease subunit [Runella defluvii]